MKYNELESGKWYLTVEVGYESLPTNWNMVHIKENNETYYIIDFRITHKSIKFKDEKVDYENTDYIFHTLDDEAQKFCERFFVFKKQLDLESKCIEFENEEYKKVNYAYLEQNKWYAVFCYNSENEYKPLYFFKNPTFNKGYTYVKSKERINLLCNFVQIDFDGVDSDLLKDCESYIGYVHQENIYEISTFLTETIWDNAQEIYNVICKNLPNNNNNNNNNAETDSIHG